MRSCLTEPTLVSDEFFSTLVATKNEKRGYLGGRSDTTYTIWKMKSGSPCEVRIDNKVNVALGREAAGISLTLMWGNSFSILPKILRCITCLVCWLASPDVF